MVDIYIAGFDVFYRNAKEIGLNLKNLCRKYGFDGLFPLDNEIACTDKKDCAYAINEGNIGLINRSHIVIANLNNFRGNEPDSGTVFECGYAHALGKKIYGYVDDIRPLKDKYPNAIFIESAYVDENDMLLEDFDLPLNLMLSCNLTIVQGAFEDCLKLIDKKDIQLTFLEIMKRRYHRKRFICKNNGWEVKQMDGALYFDNAAEIDTERKWEECGVSDIWANSKYVPLFEL